MSRPALLLSFLGLGLGLGLGGCGYTPQQLGITGPGTNQTPVASHASEADEDATIPDPGLPAGFGSRYAPAATSGDGEGQRFYGYN